MQMTSLCGLLRNREIHVINAFIGRLMLTNERLIFLSFIGDGLAEKMAEDLLKGYKTSGGVYLREFDMSAQQNKGSLNAPLRDIVSCEFKSGWFRASHITFRIETFIGEVGVFSFAPRYGSGKKLLHTFRNDFLEMKARFG
jgi:hypothetical protein